MKKTIMIAVAAIAAGSFAAVPRNVILFIGDGMSVPQRMTADEFSRKSGRGQLVMNNLPYTATTRTCSADSLVTDSAAAATAIACGVKTNNHRSGVDPNGETLVSCAEVARDAGFRVGIVTTVTTTHATPAGFYAHRLDRGDGYGIALDLYRANFDVVAGGGLGYGYGDKRHAEYVGNIYKLAATNGYAVVTNRADFLALKNGTRVMTRFVDSALPAAIDCAYFAAHPDELDKRRDKAAYAAPRLPELVAKSIELLENPNGFFMMVEGGRIDWAGHSNDAGTNLRDVLELDSAVKVALDYQKRHSGDTLVIVTGDHETGGMSMGFAATGYALYMDRLTNQTMSVGLFDERMRGAFKRNADLTLPDVYELLGEAFGFKFVDEATLEALEEAEKAAAKESNEAFKVAEKAKKALRLARKSNATAGEIAALAKAEREARAELAGARARHDAARVDPMIIRANERAELEAAIRHDAEFHKAKIEENKAYDGEKRYLFSGVCRNILSHKCGIGWSSGGHTAMPVLTTSVGCGAERFSGFIENTDISRILKSFFENRSR